MARDLKRICVSEQITGLTAVPPLWSQVSELDWSDEAGRSLRYFANTGGHMPLPPLTRLRPMFPRATPYRIYRPPEPFRTPTSEARRGGKGSVRPVWFLWSP